MGILGPYAWQILTSMMDTDKQRRLNAYASGDAAANATGSGLYTINGEATLWGKVIPITWGNRRITGQLLQIGIQRQETKESTYHIWPQYDTDIIHPNPSTWQSNLGTTFSTSFISTFAYVFGAPGNRTSRQILKKLWFNGQLVYDIGQGYLSNQVRFRFYQGDEGQLPDVELNRTRYQYPVAYRGLMYIVFYEYAIVGSTAQGNPVVEAEFGEEVSNTNPVTAYNPLGSAINTDVNIANFDPKKGFIYSIGSNGNIYKYRVADRQLVSFYPMTGLPSSVNPATAASCQSAFLRVNGVAYLVFTGSGSNSTTIVLVNADTGVVADTLGNDNSGLTPNPPDEFPSIKTFRALTLQTENGEVGWVAGRSIFNQIWLFRVSAGQIEYVKYYSLALAADEVLAMDTGGTPDLISSKGAVLSVNGTAYHTAPHNITAIFPCTFDNTMIVFSSTDANNWAIQKVARSGATVIWQDNAADYPGLALPLVGSSINWRTNSNTAGGQRLGWSTSSKLAILDMLSGEISVIANGGGASTGNLVYDAFTNRMIYPTGSGSSTAMVDFPILNQTSGNILLSTFLRNIAELQGYETANITIENIPDQIVGAAITEKTDIDTMLNDIRRVYNFTIVKSGRFIKFTRRGYGSSFIVDADYTDAQRAVLSDSKDEVITVETEMATPLQSAGTIRLKYIDPDYQYTANEFTYKRNDPDYDVSVELSINLPIIMQGSEAAALAARVLVDSNMNTTTHEFRLPQRYISHEPGDVVTLQFPDYSDTVRIVEISYNADYSLSIKSEAIYTQDGPSYELYDPIMPAPPPDLLQGAAEPLIFDTTLISYTDQVTREALEIYIGAVPAERLAVGGSNLVTHQVEDGDMTPVGMIDSTLTYGSAITLLPSGPVLQCNYTDTLTFRMTQGDGNDFVTDDVLDVLAGTNRILVGNTSRWEHIGFIEAAFDASTGIVTLTGLIRGLRGTEVFAGTHQVGDYVVLIDETAMLKVVESEATLDAPVIYAISDSLGRPNLNDAAGIVMMGIARRPWAPYNVHVVNAAGDLTITWKRRTRLNGPLNNGNSTVPLDETSEMYRLVLYRAGTAVRTLEDLTSPTFTYTAAMQTADGWSGSITSLQLDVAQISSLVGPGFNKSGTYDVE